MLSYNLLIIICIACIISIYTYSFYRKDAIVSGTADSASRLHLLSSRLEVACDELINIVQNCAGRKSLFHTSVLDRQSQRSGESSGIYAAEVLRDLCAISGYNRYIHKITVYERDSLFIQAGTSYGSWDDADSIMAAPWFNELLTKNMQEYTLTLKENPFPLDAKTVPYILPLIRPLQYSKKDTPQDAWVCLLLSPRLFQDTLELLSQDRSVLIMTGGLSPIESTNMGHFSMEEIKAALEAHPSPTGSMRTALSGMDCILTWERLAVSGLLLCEVLPVKDISPDPNAILFTVGLVFLSCIAIGLSLSLLFTRYLTRPIMRLTQQKMDLEIKMLQAQINPHFLYNTLDSIKWIATMQHSTGIVRVVSALSSLLKNMAKGFNEKVTIRQELDFVDHYITIEKIRYIELFDVEIVVEDPALYDARIIKLTLQPLVENSIFSGIVPSGKPGSIQIHISSQDEVLYIRVRDNGVGISEENITRMLTDTSRVSKHYMSGIGLPNVDRRIKLVYGQAYGLTIESQVGVYTCVTISIPLEWGDGDWEEKARTVTKDESEKGGVL